MPRVTIDGQSLEVPDGTTVLRAAARLGVEIPALCWREGLAPSASCMVCVVRVAGRAGLVPACATPVADGMVIESETEEVRAARRTALELLLADHLGDCVAPCQLACPAGLDIPRMNRLLAAGRVTEAVELVRQTPRLSSACDTCDGRCEKACRRGLADGAVSIRRLVQFVLDAAGPAERPEPAPPAEPAARPWSVHVGRPTAEELQAFLAEGSDAPRVEPADGKRFSAEEARREAARCLHCDCRKPVACKLRYWSQRYGANPRRFRTPRRTFTQDRRHGEVLYEPGKCIACGLCVQIAERAGEELGLTFVGRGFDVRVAGPFSAGLDEALRRAAAECAAACPTGALAPRDE